MVTQQIDAMAEVQSAFRLFTRHWILGVPLLIGYCVFFALIIIAFVIGGGAAMISGGLTGGDPRAIMAALGSAGILVAIFGLVGALVLAIAHAAVYSGAEEAWQGRAPSIGAAIGVGLSKLPQMIVAFLILLIPFIICGLLAAVFIGIPLLIALGFLMMFVLPAIVIGGAGGWPAIQESWRLTTKNFGPSAMAFLAVVVISIIGTIINLVLGHIPIIGQIIGLVISIAVGVFSALVVVRFYDLLRGGARPPSTT